MKLVRISENVLINPGKISSVEYRGGQIIVRVDGERYDITTRVDMDAFMKELMGADTNLWGAQHFRG